jgi:hypothetical protein
MSDVAVSICDLINFTADFIRVVEPRGKGESFSLICPTCTDPTKPSQKYLCGTCQGQFSTGELDRAREIKKVLHKVTPEEIEAARETLLPEKEIHLHPVSAVDFYQHSRADGVAYRLRADKLGDVVAMITDLVTNLSATVVLVGEMNAGRSTEKLFTLTTWNGALILQEVARPDEVISFTAEKVDYNDKLLTQATMFVSGQVGEFDAANFANRRKQRIAELDVAKAGGTTVSATPAAPKANASDSLLALLEAQIASSKVAESKKAS